MRFNIYGHYDLEVIRDGTEWKVFKLGEGKRAFLSDIVIPGDLGEHEIETYLDDLFHEFAKPGQSIRRIG